MANRRGLPGYKGDINVSAHAKDKFIGMFGSFLPVEDTVEGLLRRSDRVDSNNVLQYGLAPAEPGASYWITKYQNLHIMFVVKLRCVVTVLRPDKVPEVISNGRF